jgi:hypothetical protein
VRAGSESEGEAPGGDSGSDDEDGAGARIFFTNCSKTGVAVFHTVTVLYMQGTSVTVFQVGPLRNEVPWEWN